MKAIASFLFFLSVACVFSVGKHAKTLPAYIWDMPPSIVNCIDKEDMNPKLFDDAVKFWESYGHEFLFKENNKSDICESDYPYGFIIVKVSYDLEYYILGQTEKIYRKPTNKMKGSIIYLNYYYIDDGLILTHEIGHALGYKHVDQIGHIMNPMRPNADYYFY
jgi:hypothetical protein